MSNKTLVRGCHCGDVRYKVAPSKSTLVVSHCTERQKQSSSAFGLTMNVPYVDGTLLQGDLHHWPRTTDSGNIQHTYHCSTCGSRILKGDRETEEIVKLWVGPLGTPVDVAQAIHIWTNSRLPSVLVPEGAKYFPENPG